MEKHTIVGKPPDIVYLTTIAEKYIDDLDNYKEDIDNTYQDLANGFQKIITIGQKTGALRKIFPQENLYTQFLEDFLSSIYVSLSVAWSLGRSFAEAEPKNAKLCISIRDYNSDVLPDKIRADIKNLGDNAAYLDLLFLQQLYNNNYVKLSQAISISDNRKRMYREGALHMFIRGIIRFYQIKQP